MMDWSRIDTVMFDMDGTLLDLHFDNYFWEYLVPATYGERYGLNADQAWDHLVHHFRDQRGTLNWYCVDYWTHNLNLDIRAMKRDIREKIAIRRGVPRLLQRLREHDKKILLVTNAHPMSLSLKMQHTGLEEHFHGTFSSHDLGLAKEHEGFWLRLRELEDHDPARSVLIDDNVAVLGRAREEGIRHLLGIEQPDSQRPPLPRGEFRQIRDFDQIMPAAPAVKDEDEPA